MEDEFKMEEVVKLEPEEEIEKKCHECDKTFKSDSTLAHHILSIHGTVDQLPCPICGKSVSSKQSLENHMRTHTGEKPYICQDCGKRFSDRSGLNCHKAVHDENRKMYKCDQCGRDFTRNSFLKRHLKLHEFSDDQVLTHSTLPSWTKTEKKNYSHEVKTEAIKHALEHGAAQTSEQLKIPRPTLDAWLKVCRSPVTCELCGAVFANNSGLERHNMHMHSRETDSQPDDVQPAVRIHAQSFKSEVVAFALDKSMGEASKKYNVSEKAVRRWVRVEFSPFSCNICEKKFAYERELKRHEIRHLATKEEKKIVRKNIETQMKVRTSFAEHFMNLEDKPNVFPEKNMSEGYGYGPYGNPPMWQLPNSFDNLDSGIQTKPIPEHFVATMSRPVDSTNNGFASETIVSRPLDSTNNGFTSETIVRIQERDVKPYSKDVTESDQSEHSLSDDTESGENLPVDKMTDISEVNDNNSMEVGKEDGSDLYEAMKIEVKQDLLEAVKVEIEEKEDAVVLQHDGIKQEPNEVENFLKPESQTGEMGFLQSVKYLKERFTSKEKGRGRKANTGPNSERPMCSICGLTFKKRFDLEAHQVTHTGIKQYSCEVCHKKFAFKNCVARHMKTVHVEVKQYICPECGKSFTQKHSVDYHVKVVHRGIRDERLTHNCDDCGKSFIKSKFLIHQKRCPFKKVLQEAGEGSDKLEKALQFLKECHVCGKQMTKGGNLKRHIQAHFKIKEFTCQICNDKYADKRNLKMHIQRAHPEEAERIESTDKLQCDICPSSFKHKRDLELHKVNDHNENYFFTCLCGEGFIKTNFEIVISRHRRTCPKMESHLKCTVCEKQFTRQQDFEYHMRRHAKNKTPCICDQCGKEFTDPVDLQKHVKLHGIRAYYCNHCGKPFADADELEYHIRTHTEIKPFSCDLCGKLFPNEIDLMTHLKKNHPHSEEFLYTQEENTLVDGVKCYE